MAIEPVTREERFFAAAGGQSVTPPTPITRKEQLLQGIIDAVKSGGATPDVIKGAVNDYLNANPVNPGATTEQAAQIEQNKNDIADLQADVDELKESGGNGSGQNAALTSAQVDLLEDAFAHIQWADAAGPQYAAQLIASLRSGESGGEEPEPEEPGQPEQPTKTLVSISAVYTGGNVPVGTAVSGLGGVVVTAHYSDGSTANVTGYTLSGTIAEGENTVTVTYMGKTTTITVTGEAQASEGRKLLHSWVLSDAEGGNIDTVGGAYANTRNGTEKTPNGYVLAGGDDVIYFSAALIAPNRTIEVDIGDVSFFMPDNENFSALCVFGDSAYPKGGKYWLCWYKPQNKWAWLDTSAGWTPTTFIDGLGTADAIAGVTLKLSINSTGGLSLYIGDALLSTAPFTVVDAPYLQFGKANEGYNRATISAVRVYQEVL